jgi:hypothetical protein
MRFRYTKVNSISPLGKLIQLKVPIVKIEFPNTFYNCMIDSGASISHMHADLGRFLGLDIEKGRHTSSKGVRGISFPSYVHKIKFKIESYICEIDVAFSDEFNLDVGLLGREGFFDLFNIYFFQSNDTFELSPVNIYT